ncbi:MAG: twin-arginine translocase subunit TatC [bacterium]
MAEKLMPLTGHLDELRSRLIKMIGSVSVGFFLCYFFSERIISLLQAPLNLPLVFIAPTEAFLTNLKVAFFSGIGLAYPIIGYQWWAFIRPGLKENERSHAVWLFTLGPLLFCLGSAFAYWGVLPLGIKFLLSFKTASLVPMLTLNEYISFCLLMIVAFGLIFNLPLAVVILARIGIITPARMRSSRKYAVLIIFVLAALLTPPDVFTQTMMALPLLLLYEVSIWLAGKTGK